MEHKIEFERTGKVVEIDVSTDLQNDVGGTWQIPFKWTCSTDYEAELLLRYLRDRHSTNIKAVRKAEFHAGWKHAKAKKKGLAFFNWFMGNMRTEATHK